MTTLYDTDALQAEYERLETEAHSIQAERDEALSALRETYDERLQNAVNAASEAQKVWMDAEAANALVGREDAETVASNLGLTLPEG